MEIPEVLKGVDLARALKDEKYRSSLTAEQQQAIASYNQLSDEDLDEVAGGSSGGGATYLCRPTTVTL